MHDGSHPGPRSHSVLAMAVALCVMALSACSAAPQPQALQADAPPEVPVVTLKVQGFSDYEKAKILLAVNEWNATGFAHFEWAQGASTEPKAGPSAKLSAAAPEVWTIENSAAWAPAAAVTLKPLRMVIVFASNRCELSGVIRHELGHVLGLSHTTHGLMRPNCALGAYDHIDAATLQTLAAVEQAHAGSTPLSEREPTAPLASRAH